MNTEENHLPGAVPLEKTVSDQIEMRKKQQAMDHPSRTHWRLPDGAPKYTNRLFLETSPYLLQHAHNPVNWYPWGEAAFDQAKKLDRPVLLSIGYSTCHWCHVMEEESFEDKDIAQYLNENYIAIKVDREERPDIDSIFMKAVQAITGGGGWPLNVWLTADKQPFYGGTYFPARDGDRGAVVGFLTILKKISTAYLENRENIWASSRRLTELIRTREASGRDRPLPDENVLKSAVAAYRESYDPTNGGITGAPKFPSSLPIRFLLRHHRRTGDPESLTMAVTTLEKMAQGGIYDHIGGGFHRYATDHLWRVPHFEKMLYDNALLAMTYLEGYQVTGDERFRRVVTEIFDYIVQEMTSPEGAFYSASDADSLTPEGDRREGYYFTWTLAELSAHLSPGLMDMATAHFFSSEKPDLEDRYIPHLNRSRSETAKALGVKAEVLEAGLREIKNRLYRARRLRPAPLRDEKILASWNGLMISAFAQAGRILKKEDYIRQAVRAAEFVWQNMTRNNRLFRSFKDGQAGVRAFLQDYAFFIAGLIDLYEATQHSNWLEAAIAFDRVMERHFEDTQNGGFYMTADDHEKLPLREKPSYDGAVPSGNSIAVHNLFRLAIHTQDDRYRRRAEKTLQAFSEVLHQTPTAMAEMLLSIEEKISDLDRSLFSRRKANKKDIDEKIGP